MREFEEPIYVERPRPVPSLEADNFEEPIYIEKSQPISIPPLEFEEPIYVDENKVIVNQPISIPNETLDNIFKQYGRKLTKEDIVNDERLMDVVRTSLEARFTPGGVLTKARRAATGLAGGTIGGLSRDYRGMSNDDAFET